MDKITNEMRYKTAEERVKEFNLMCDSNDDCAKCHIKKEYKHECFAHWLTLEAEEKPEPCPFCGKEVVVGFSENIHKEKYRQVWCSDGERCGYECVVKKTEAEAISAHNRVARAVMAAKEGEVK